ncbi:unnamed protein product [Durusdinium trenchii]|uniref:Uncharacterized protein n=1 Tax=Durusdinium trenchii TaxID=1381693 RepID=A0ABP0MBT6_9DINO
MKFQSFSEATEVGLYCWNPEGGRQKRFKDVTVEDIQRGLQTPTEPPKLQLDRVRCPLTFLQPERCYGPSALNMFPHDPGYVVSLYMAKEMGVDLDSVDFLLGGSSLNIMATKRIEAGDKYLVQRVGSHDHRGQIQAVSAELWGHRLPVRTLGHRRAPGRPS